MKPPALSRDIALFLDFDGTLVELAPTPDAVKVPAELPGLLNDLSKQLDGALALVSGRQIDDLLSWIAPLRLPAAGSHGMERLWGDGSMQTPGNKVLEDARAITAKLNQAFAGQTGVRVENKDWSPTLHFRGAPKRRQKCLDVMRRVIADRPGWAALEGKMVIEARYGGISKADSVREFMWEAPFAGRRPVFIGDDVTDEDGMRAAMALGGYAIKVGEGDSVARYRLEDPFEVLNYLKLAEI